MTIINKDKKRIVIVLIVILSVILGYFLGYRIGRIGATGNVVPTFKEDNLKIIRVIDEKMKEITGNDLDIFENEKFNNQNIIAPQSNGSYQFYIENLTDKPVLYDINFLDKMTNKINMKYRLKIDNVYVKGDANSYISLAHLSTKDIMIPANSFHVVILEWYWEDDDINDTYVGSLSNQHYTLELEVDARLKE